MFDTGQSSIRYISIDEIYRGKELDRRWGNNRMLRHYLNDRTFFTLC